MLLSKVPYTELSQKYIRFFRNNLNISRLICYNIFDQADEISLIITELYDDNHSNKDYCIVNNGYDIMYMVSSVIDVIECYYKPLESAFRHFHVKMMGLIGAGNNPQAPYDRCGCSCYRRIF